MAEIFKAVPSGECTESLADKNPGEMAHSRWLTTASRILRLYVSSEVLSQNLRIIVLYVMKVYVTTWFDIKRKSSIIYGAQHLHKMIKRSRIFEPNILKKIDPVVERNSFFAHPENILLSMIHDDMKNIRELGWKKILKSRDGSSSHSTLTIRS